MKKSFNALDLDKLVNESIAEADGFNEEMRELEQVAPSLPTADDWADKENVVNKETSGTTISYDYVYKKIGELISNGNAALQMLQSIEPDMLNPATLAAESSLMNAIHGCISEFTKIHQQYIKFQQAIQLEREKFKNHRELIELRSKLRNNAEAGLAVDQPQQMVETSTSDMIEYLKFKREKAAREEEQKNKI